MSAICRWIPIVVLAVSLVAGGWGTLTPARAADNHKAGASDAEHDPHAGAAGGVDLPMKFKGDLALWSFVTFLVFFLVLSKIAWKPLTAALDKRESGIEKNIIEAEAARVKAQQMLAEHERKLATTQEQIRAMLDEARRDAETAKQTILAEAAKQAEAERKRAVADIEQAKNVALGQLFDAMSDRVVAATEHVIGRSLNEGDHSRLVSEALAQVSQKA